MKIAVFMGGSSAEREISLMSGESIAKALKTTENTVDVYDVEWEGSSALIEAVGEVSHNGTDLVFLALHGGLGENGGVQGMLEAAGIPYTGSGITASAVAMDKDISKTLFIHNGIPTAPWIAGCPEALDTSRISEKIGYPCVVKPADQGSTIGLSVVKNTSELEEAVSQASAYSKKIMAESYITGKELSVPILADDCLPVIEIRPSHEIYDYECKYTAGMCNYSIPAPLPDKLADMIRSYALKVYNLLDLRDIARIDFRLDEKGCPLCFEANTLPGMTSTSLVPKSASKTGIDFTRLVTMIAVSAIKRKGNVLYGT